MTMMEKLEQLEDKLRVLLSEREEMKARLKQIGGLEPGPREAPVGDGQETYARLLREREAIRDRVQSLLAAISKLNKAS